MQDSGLPPDRLVQVRRLALPVFLGDATISSNAGLPPLLTRSELFPHFADLAPYLPVIGRDTLEAEIATCGAGARATHSDFESVTVSPPAPLARADS